MSSTAAAVAHEATTHGLWTQAAEVAGRLNRAHGELVEIAAQLVEGGHWGDGGFSSPEHLLVVRAGLSPAQAGDVVRIARRRAELPDAVAALAAGELSIGQAAVVARHGRADHQAGIAKFARTATVPQLRRALSTSVFLEPDTAMPSTASPPVAGAPGPEPAVDPLATLRAAEAQRLADRACARPDLSMHYDESGRFHLRYSAPAEIGALVEQAVKEAKDALFTAAAGTDGSSPGERVAWPVGSRTPSQHDRPTPTPSPRWPAGRCPPSAPPAGPATTASTCTSTPTAAGSTAAAPSPRGWPHGSAVTARSPRSGDRGTTRLGRSGPADPARADPSPHRGPRPRLPHPRLRRHQVRRDPPPRPLG